MDIYVTELWVDKALRYDDMNPCKYNLSLSNEVLVLLIDQMPNKHRIESL